MGKAISPSRYRLRSLRYESRMQDQTLTSYGPLTLDLATNPWSKSYVRKVGRSNLIMSKSGAWNIRARRAYPRQGPSPLSLRVKLANALLQSKKPIVSSMIAAKVLVSRCFPLVMGGNCANLTRKPSESCIAGARFLHQSALFQ